ncbi:MAG: PilZ domain-containing protein [Pseudomonadota bacterium]
MSHEGVSRVEIFAETLSPGRTERFANGSESVNARRTKLSTGQPFRTTVYGGTGAYMSGNRLQERLARLAAPSRLSLPSPAQKSGRKDLRAGDRERVYKFATLTTGRQTSMDCIVLDITNSGARVSLQGAYRLPREARLRIPQLGFDRSVQIRWQNESEVGLSF